MAAKTIRAGVIGYGPAFNMGPHHGHSINKNKGLEVACVCDLDKKRLEVAKTDFPGIKTYKSVARMLNSGKIDLAIVITPHNTHAKLVLQCIKAKVHVVCEKPLAITGKEVSEMLKAAKQHKVMFSTFHNRRWDGDFVALRKIVREGLIGNIFRIECGFSGYHEQPTWWRADKKISGGAIYDWGAHFTDWMLNLVDSKIDTVTGFQVKNPRWTRYTNEDHSEYTLTFKDGCLATLTMSNLSMETKPRWRILGDNGSIVHAGDHFLVKAIVKGRRMETKVEFERDDWDAYYKNIADHLLRGKPLVITPESAARVIGVLHAANISAATGCKPVKPLFP